MIESFDDPQLKTALRRACGSQSAPADLRDKILSLQWGEQVIRRPSRSQWTFRYALVAAAVLIAIGSFIFATRTVALPVDVASNMIDTHDRCSQSKTHDYIKGGFTAIGERFVKDLKIPVISTSLEGWQFAGAAECGVWGHPSAHLLYRRGNQTLSVFTVPASDFALPATDNSYANSANGHFIASFTKGGGLYSVVENSTDGSASAADTALIRDRLLKNFPSDSIAYIPTKVIVAANIAR